MADKNSPNPSLLQKRKPEDSPADPKASKGKQPEVPSAQKWWDKEPDSDDDETKWQYLEHNGVLFPPFYQPHKVKPLYDGKPIELTPEQEEYATYWCQTMGTIWETNDIYRKNFKSEFLPLFKEKKMELEKFDFTPVQRHLNEKKEEKKNRSADEKKKEKEQKQQLDAKYGYAMVDGVLEKVGGYYIEIPTLFKGRGKHPKAGLMKARIMPEDITINVAENAPIPKCTMKGHCWGDVIHNNTVTWLAFYSDDTIVKTHKYIYLAASSKFKGLNDKMKYEKARRLKNVINKIRQDYRRKLTEKDMTTRQIGTATYLIDKLALRVGNEKSEEEADTVGCCSLRVEHIKIEDDNKITLDFLGKDSMRYFNTVQVDEIVHKNLADFIRGKKPQSDLFDQISTSNLNDYLKSQMDGLTAKVFRTYNASFTLQNELDKKDLSSIEDVDAKVDYYNEANRQVAILCNHQKTVSKNFDVQKEKLQERLNDHQEYLKELKDHLKKVERMSEAERSRQGEKEKDREAKEVAKREKEAKDLKEKGEKNEKILRRYPYSTEKIRAAMSKIEKAYKKLQSKMKMKEENKDIALGTSKINYNDPRISVAWCKANEVPIEKVFPKALRSKFVWAMYADELFKF